MAAPPRFGDLAARLPALLPGIVRWAEEIAGQAALEGRPLSRAECGHANEVGVQRSDLVRVVEVERFPQPEEPALAAAAAEAGFLGPSTAGLTLGQTILIRRGSYSPALLRHELRHVHQVEAAGSLAAFLERYLQQVVTVGYQDAPLEIDARAYETASASAAPPPE